jgi:hypothetical protein
MGRQTLTEGWVTINGHHVLIGDEEKMVGGADVHKEFTGQLTPAQTATAVEIERHFQNTWSKSLPSDFTDIPLPVAVKDAARELASANFNPKILEAAPLSKLSVDDETAKDMGAAAFYKPDDKTLTLSEGVKDPVVVHEFGHHLDFAWTKEDGYNDLARSFAVPAKVIRSTAKAAADESYAVVYKIQQKLSNDPRSVRTKDAFIPNPELDKELKNMAISKYAAQGGSHEWIAEGVRQYTASPRARAALQKQFPATYTYVNGLITGDFPKASE